MAITPKFKAKVDPSGSRYKYYPSELQKLVKYLRNLADKDIEIIIKKYRRKRTLAQNSYYRGVIVPLLAEYFGYSTEETHNALLWEHSKVQPEGKPATVKRTSDMNTEEMNNYQRKIREWAEAEYNFRIPLPNEVEYE